MIKYILLVVLLTSSLEGLKLHKKRTNFENVPKFKTLYTDQYLDHFNKRDDRTYKQRFLVNDEWFNPNDGPVFFYAGNEGDIESFWNNTGFMFDIAPVFQALVVFPEHRYYGESLPFGDSSFDQDKIGFLSVEQTMADYAVLLTKLQQDYNLCRKKNPIIAFGGSYGGILAAYMRYKYPNIVRGALAASAPIYLTAGLAPSTLFFQDVTNDFDKEPGCVPLVRQAFDAMENAAKQGDYKLLSEKFKLCEPISDAAGYKHLLLWMRNAFTIMAMVDYPYPASFLGDLPAWPVRFACQQLVNDTAKGVDILSSFKNLASILYNDTSKCFDIYEQFIECADPTSCGLGNDAKSWDYQACTELNTVQETNGVSDMFPVISYNEELREQYCLKTWGVKVRKEWPSIQFWGKHIKTATNIVFSNGLLDPWHNGGPLTNVSDSLVAVIIEDGAHHLDLRGSDPNDPQSVKIARYLEIEQIIKWIEEARKEPCEKF
ncbi:dipeptidyl peptidase 2-like [Brachionus plicatilis]|uniref:Dipeptidyl peptidase 2-like n=1 Tax=Brachionus plicatilis TaxID=10195 RepID=A0A3M7R5E4_BRAPC|nr:dipeptidyl peptidase 2-like [Brachionus plicatilis]